MCSRWFAATLVRPCYLHACVLLFGLAVLEAPCAAQDQSPVETPAELKPTAPIPDQSTPVEPVPAVEAPSTEVLPPSKPTQQECQAFVEALKEAVAAGDARQINQLFDWDTILAHGMAGIDPQLANGPDLLAKFRGIESIVDDNSHPIIGVFEPGATYKPLRVRYAGGRPEVVCRLILPGNGGVTYQRILLKRRSDGAVLAGDLYLFASGEYISETFRRYVLSSLARTNPEALKRTSTAEREFVHHLATCERMVQSINGGNHDEVLAAYALLPKTLQQEKSIFLMQLRASPKLGLHGWQKTMAEARRLFPNDPTFDLQLMGDYNQQGKHDEALAALERLEKSLGGDPYLLLLRGNLYLQTGNFGNAKKWLDNAITAEPGLVQARLSRINCALYQNDFAEVVKQLEALEALGEQLADLTKVSGYKRFVASPEYRNWMQSRRKISQTKAK